ncbi:MAG: THUMP domain-containing class I SAM-dependent RNA methyltransferase [Flavobacteriales bacterium]|jgi:putative N6-adenine-specific DNA methylase|tara:strand:+ start:19 stop:1173 length:1155 start_codon:yes stop_codon:yes gene_type:complete
MKNDNFYMLAKTMYGLEEILAEELKDLGAQNVKIQNRAVSFKGDTGFMYKANLNLRTCLRVLKPIATFQAHNEKELYNNILKIDWEKYLDLKNTFATDATTNSEIFTHSKYASLLVKDGIADFFRKKYDERPNVDPKDPDITINLHIAKHTCTVSIDSSGESLHKRGYKSNTIIAPMNEVLAAGLILLSGWDQKSNFHDPMCGSGTILIEAALIAYNIPANIFREKFGFETWKDFDLELFEKIKDVSLDKEKDFQSSITGGDNFQKAVRITRENIENALMFDNIKVKNEDFFDTKVFENSFVIFNPPYGERIELGINEFYEKVGDSLKNNYKNCTVWLISSDLENLKMIGLKPSKKIELMNGNLKCSFREFKIYEGSKKQKLIK